MRIVLLLLCLLCATPVHNIFEGTCLRKDPPPGVLVLSPGSKLVLSCSGLVKVDGLKVSITGQSTGTNQKGNSDATTTIANIISNTAVSVKSDNNALKNTASSGYHRDTHPNETGGNNVTGEHPEYTDRGYTAHPTSPTVWPTSVSRQLTAESDWDDEGDYEEEEEEEGIRVTRGIKSRPRWKWNGRIVGEGDRWGQITFERGRTSLSLASVTPKDSGNYTCHYRGRETLSLKVIVTEHPEAPQLSCYKKSPSSKIRCDWTPQRPVTKRLNCYLLLRKSPTDTFLPLQCSYSSRCWCAIDHNEDELRTLHMAYLCVTNMAGNVTSSIVTFTPLDILKPDPPSHVSVQQEEGQETRIIVTWNLPKSWKPQDRYYELIYEMKYQPCGSTVVHEQIKLIKGECYHCSNTITDVMPGVKYLIQLRAKEEYDGQWSGWTTPVYASSWTAPPLVLNDLTTTMQFPTYEETEGSGTTLEYDSSDATTVSDASIPVLYHILWISGSFTVLSVILAANMFRRKERLMSKLHRLNVKCCGASQPPPPSPTAPEGQALMAFAPMRYKEPRLSEGEKGEEEEEETEEEQRANEMIESMHFNNTSYFFIQRE